MKLKGKKILFIAAGSYAAAAGLKGKMESMGVQVDFINDKPNERIVCKTLGRLHVKIYIPILERYYRTELNKIRSNEYDVIFIIKGEYTPIASLVYMRNLFQDAEMILYMWDSISNNKGIEKKWSYFDRVITFDRIDYLNHKNELEFWPLYYYEDCIPKVRTEQSDKFKYDLAFIGTGHGDRFKIIKEIQQYCEKRGLRFYSYLFLPHKLVYWYNKVCNKYFRHAKKKDFHYSMLSMDKMYSIYDSAKCVIDIESSSQCGLTMRTIEMIGLHKKMITTNKDIVNYDFYNENNISVVDRENVHIKRDFLEKDYQPLSEEIYYKYSLESWLYHILG